MRRTSFIAMVSASTMLMAMPQASRAQSITITSSRDTTLYQNNANNNGGGSPAIFAGTNSQPSIRRGLIAFNVAGSSIPAGSTITGVQLKLFLAQVAGTGGGSGTGPGGATQSIDLLPITKNWGEGVGLFSQTMAGGSGQGTTALSGEATWNSNFNSISTWTTPGGDNSGVVSGSMTSSDVTVNDPFLWTSTALNHMVADVQSWLDSPLTNFGWEMVNEDESDATTFRAFWTGDASRIPAEATFVPQLTITFTPAPEPTTIALGSLAYLGWSMRRRRV